MKLRHALAGTVALPLALAVASANAATIVDNDEHRLNIGGFVAAQHSFTSGDGDDHHGMTLGTSRLNTTYTNKTEHGDITVFYENDWASDSFGPNNYRLRHAVIMYDGWTAGFTWSFFSNLNGTIETLEPNGNAVRSAATARNAVVGKRFELGDGMSFGVALEDHGNGADSFLPDIVANFSADLGVAQVFAATQFVQTEDDDTQLDITASAAMPLGDAMTLKVAMTNRDGDDTFISFGGQMKLSDELRANLAVEQALMDLDDRDYTAIWANAIYTMPVGLEWGAEVGYVIADDDSVGPAHAHGWGNADGDLSLRLQARYAF